MRSVRMGIAVVGLVALTAATLASWGLQPARGAVKGAVTATGSEAPILRVDIAENGSRFSFDETPVHDDGLPAYGNEFVTQGYIYPAGTLDGTNGVLPDGAPEFPDLVMGEWTCRGWHIGDGAHTESGPVVVTTQLYSLGDQPGKTTVVTDGYELADIGVAVRRAIVGGTGTYAGAGGVQFQTFLGFNASNGVNLRVLLVVHGWNQRSFAW